MAGETGFIILPARLLISYDALYVAMKRVLMVQFYRIETPNRVYGAFFVNGLLVKTDLPFKKWMIGQYLSFVKHHIRPFWMDFVEEFEP
jgi:hypothetical protein